MRKAFLTLVLAFSLGFVSGCAQAPPTKTKGSIIMHGTVITVTPPTAAFTRILISFKLDPRLAGGTYGGEHWVSPDIFTGANAQETVEAKAQGIDANGQAVSIDPEWVPTDPDMLTVSTAEDGRATLTINRAGESSLQVTAGGISKTLTIKATSVNNIMQVIISQ